MLTKVITATFVGGLIGLVTNGFAIRMIFRPLKQVKIGKIRVPFTPGLIPQERVRIAEAIGEVVSNDLLNNDTLKSTLLSEEIRSQIDIKIDNMIYKYSDSENTVATVAKKLIADGSIYEKLIKAEKALAETITRKALEQNIGTAIADYAYEEIVASTKPVLRNLTGTALKTLKNPFAEKINIMIEDKSIPVIEMFLAKQTDEVMEMPLKDIIENQRDKIPQIKEYVWKIFNDIVENRLESILKTIDIAEIVSNKIKELDLLELEGIIMSLVKRELNALIYLGGLLGMIMGLLNVVFNILI